MRVAARLRGPRGHAFAHLARAAHGRHARRRCHRVRVRGLQPQQRAAPSEAGLYRSAMAAYEKALQLARAEDIVPFGRSLGSAPAVHMAANAPTPCAALLLQSPLMSGTQAILGAGGGDRSAVRRCLQELRQDRRRSLPRRHRARHGRRSGPSRTGRRSTGAAPTRTSRCGAGPRAQQHGREGRPQVLPWSSRLR